MHQRKLLALVVSRAALAATAAPVAAAPVSPERHADHIIAVLIGLEVQPPGPLPSSSPSIDRRSSELQMPGASTWGS